MKVFCLKRCLLRRFNVVMVLVTVVIVVVIFVIIIIVVITFKVKESMVNVVKESD